MGLEWNNATSCCPGDMLSVDNRAVADVARIVSDWNKRDGRRHRCNYTQAESEITTHAHPESQSHQHQSFPPVNPRCTSCSCGHWSGTRCGGRGVARGWPGCPKPPAISYKKKYNFIRQKQFILFTTFTLHIKLHSELQWRRNALIVL